MGNAYRNFFTFVVNVFLICFILSRERYQYVSANVICESENDDEVTVIEVNKNAAKARETAAAMRLASEDWYVEIMEAMVVNQCEKKNYDEIQNRLVDNLDSTANVDRRGNCKCSKDFLDMNYDCETQCEVEENCYWGPVVENEDREPKYDDSDVKASEEMQEEYQFGLLKVMVPQIVLGVLVFFGTFVYFIFRCICRCKQCKHLYEPKEKGYTHNEKRLPIFFYIFFGLGVIICSFVAFAGNEDVTAGLTKTFDAVDNGIEGVIDFIGDASGPMIGVRDTTVDAANITIDIIAGTGWTAGGMAVLKDMVSHYNVSYSAREPFIGDAMGDALENIDANIDPIVGDIQTTLDTLADGLVEMRNSIVQSVNSALNMLQGMNTSLSETQGQLDTYSEMVIEYQDWRQAGVMIVFIFAIFLFVLGILAITAAWTKCKYDDFIIYSFHLVWMFGALVCTLSFIVSGVATVLSVFFVDSCEMMDILVEDFTPYMGPSTAKGLNACFNDTPLVEAYNLTEQLSFAADLTAQFAILEESDTSAAFAGAKQPVNDTGLFLMSLNASKPLEFLNFFTNNNEVNSNCPFDDVYTEEHVRTPWSESNTGAVSWNTEDYAREGTEDGLAYMTRIYTIADYTLCGFELKNLTDAWEFASEKVQLIEDMEADLGFNAELCETVSCPTEAWPYSNTLWEQLLEYERNVTLLEESLLNMTDSLVGDLINHVDDFYCNMKCGFIATLYHEMSDAMCNSLLGGFIQINGALMTLAFFQIPIILCAEILVTRLWGKHKSQVEAEKLEAQPEREMVTVDAQIADMMVKDPNNMQLAGVVSNEQEINNGQPQEIQYNQYGQPQEIEYGQLQEINYGQPQEQPIETESAPTD